MELQIGARIREHRCKRRLTQEEVAAHLGISFQAISKWERNEGYPDITLLPALAAYFETSVDDLLGMNEIAAREKYDEINRVWEEHNTAGNHEENVAIMLRALKDYPNDPRLLVQLSTSLEKLGGSDSEKKAHLRESANLQEQIIRYGKDSEIRGATQFNICFTYQKLGEYEKAIAQARKLPNLYKARENALVSFLEGEDRRRMARAALAPLRWSVALHLNALAAETQNDVLRSHARTICALLTEVEENV